MTEKDVAKYLAEMQAEHAALRQDGILQFDGSDAWERLVKAMGDEVVVRAFELREDKDAKGPKD